MVREPWFNTAMRLAALLSAAMCALLAGSSYAADAVDVARDFPLTWTTHTVAPGRQYLELWATPRIARVDPGFTLFETRFALSTGLTPWLDLQVGLDLGFRSTPSLTTLDPRLATVWRFAPVHSDELIGLGALLRGSLGIDTADLEARVLADKQLGRVLLAANASISRQFFWSGRSGVDTRLDETLAARFAISGEATVGLELRAKSGFTRGAYQGTGFYAGPTLSFHIKRFWVSLGLSVQVAADKASDDRGNGEPLELRDNERFIGSLMFGSQTTAN